MDSTIETNTDRRLDQPSGDLFLRATNFEYSPLAGMIRIHGKTRQGQGFSDGRRAADLLFSRHGLCRSIR
jgi:hypothetical protein